MRIARQEGAGGALIAVIIALVALLILAVMSFTRTKAGGEEREQATAKLNIAAETLEAYASASARLPCPANPATDDGVEVTAGATGCQFDGGTIPWKTIGMRREDSIDTWGRKISYRVFSGNTGLTQAGGASMANCDTNEAFPGGVMAGGLCKADHTTTPAQFIAGKGLMVNDMGAPTRSDAAYVLISHGLSGLGGWTASGVQLDLPGGDERDNTRDNGPFWIKPFSGPDVGVSVNTHFDDILVYRTVADMAKRSNLAARNWPDDILSAITFNRATVGAAIGDSSPPADTGRNTIAFNNATVRGFSNDTTAQNISFVSSGEDGIGLAGGDGLVGGAGGVTEFLRIDFDESARQFAFTVDKFEDTGAVHERLELRFIEVVGATATTKATVVKSSCAANGKVTSFSVDACSPFNRVELRTLSTSDSLSQSDLSLNEIRTCVEGVTCETALQPTGNVCSSKVFTPCSIGINDTSQLTVTLANNESGAMTGVDFSDTYPTLLANAATPAVSTTCTGGVATATGTGLTLVGGTVPAHGTCKVQVNVTSAALGTYANSTGNITTASSGTLAPAQGSLIALQHPVVAVDFTPPLVGTTLPSLLTVLFTNSNTQPITKLAVGGALPAGLTLHLPVTLTTTCGGTFTSSGTTILFTDGTIPAANGVIPSTCKITARVTSTAAGSYSLVLPPGAVTSGNAGANTAGASATLVVN